MAAAAKVLIVPATIPSRRVGERLFQNSGSMLVLWTYYSSLNGEASNIFTCSIAFDGGVGGLPGGPAAVHGVDVDVAEVLEGVGGEG